MASVPRLRVVACLVSSYCFLRGTAGFSSWCRYGLVSSLRVVGSFLCLRVVGSSFRRLRYILRQVLDVWGNILYRLYLHKLFLPFFAWYLVALLPCYTVTLLPCYSVTLLPCYLVTLLSCYLFTLLPCYLVSCYPVTLLLRYLVTMLPCYPVTLLRYYLVTLLPCYPVTLLLCCTLLPCCSDCYLGNLLLCYLVTLLLCAFVTLLSFF